MLRVLGCSPAWPNPGGAHSGYLVEDGSRRVLLDCGPGVLGGLRGLDGGAWPRVDAVVISHWHHDHWGDLIPWVWGTLAGPGTEGEGPELWVPPPGIDHLDSFGPDIATQDAFARVFRLHGYEENSTFRAGGLEITTAKVPHHTGWSHAMRVVADNRTIVYSADCGPNDALVALARDADLFVCEATIEDPERDWDPRTHMAAEEAVAAFEASGARRLLLTHRPAELTPPAGHELARDGLGIEL